LFSIGGYIVSDLLTAKSNEVTIGIGDLVSPSIFGVFCWFFLIKIGEVNHDKKKS
jgi:hypothetical protein